MFNISVNKNSYAQVSKEIDKYKDELKYKCTKVIEKLLDVGYEIAISNTTGTFSNYITIYKEFEGITEEGYKGVLYATDTGNLTMEFIHKGQPDSVDISPLAMIEFGSGLEAENPLGIDGVGTGTNSKYGHAYERGWAFVGMDGKLHSAKAYKPHAPMYKAMLKMQEDVSKVMKEVF